MTQQNAKVLQILVRQILKRADINIILRKALSVLGRAELFEPIHNSLHRDHRRS
jgi:hypothetical protein